MIQSTGTHPVGCLEETIEYEQASAHNASLHSASTKRDGWTEQQGSQVQTELAAEDPVCSAVRARGVRARDAARGGAATWREMIRVLALVAPRAGAPPPCRRR